MEEGDRNDVSFAAYDDCVDCNDGGAVGNGDNSEKDGDVNDNFNDAGNDDGDGDDDDNVNADNDEHSDYDGDDDGDNDSDNDDGNDNDNDDDNDDGDDDDDDDESAEVTTDDESAEVTTDDEEQCTDAPLYTGSPVSCDEFNSVFLALQCKHNFPSSATDSILKLFQMTLPTGNKCPPSNYKFEKGLHELCYSYTKNVTCHKCQHILENNLCSNMHCSQFGVIEMGNDSSIFYIIDLVEEIKRFISGIYVQYTIILSTTDNQI